MNTQEKLRDQIEELLENCTDNKLWATTFDPAIKIINKQSELLEMAAEALEFLIEGCEDLEESIEIALPNNAIHIAKQALAKHKAGDAGFTEDELVEIIKKHCGYDEENDKYDIVSIATAINALKNAGALRLKGG